MASELPTHTHSLGGYMSLGLLHPHLLLQNGWNSLQKTEFHRLTCQWFLLVHLPSLTHQSHTSCKLSSYYILPSSYITKHSSLHFAYWNPISLFYFQSQTPYFSFYKFPLKCTVRLFPLLLGYTEALFPLCHHSSSVLWFTVLFLFFPILILDNSCSPVENIHAAALWSSELFSHSPSFAPQPINLFSLQNKITEAFEWLWIFCCSASPKAATSGSWNKLCAVKVEFKRYFKVQQ